MAKKSTKETVIIQPIIESEEKAKFKALIETYKVQNYAKYLAKKDALENKLNNL